MLLMFDTEKDLRSNNVAKGIPHCKQCKKERHTHVQRWQQHRSLKAGQRLSGSRVIHPFISMADGFEKVHESSCADEAKNSTHSSRL